MGHGQITTPDTVVLTDHQAAVLGLLRLGHTAYHQLLVDWIARTASTVGEAERQLRGVLDELFLMRLVRREFENGVCVAVVLTDNGRARTR